MKDYKIALIHDWLVTIAGAESVLSTIYELYPADIFTLVSNTDALRGTIFENATVYESFIKKMPFSIKHYRKYLPIMPLAIEDFDLRDYDIVISSSHAVAKGVLTSSRQLHISYIHTPMRYAWDMYHLYLKQAGLQGSLKGLLAKLILHYLRLWDYQSIDRVDYIIANSNYVKKRIYKIYKRDSEVIYPPVDLSGFDYQKKKDDYFITISRLVPYKRIDLIVTAFSQMPELRLIVIGDGPDMDKISSLAKSNIELLGWQSKDHLKDYLESARAFVFSAEEDFGIVPVEAQACGCPVIAYSQGGTSETVVNGKTGIFFHSQSVDAIMKGVREFIQIENSFDSKTIRENAERFSKDKFKSAFTNFVETKVKVFFNE
ncbi:MAG TPA: glycosyltransferase family 4 protein [Nitrospirae bacterium]|nr:glycosyltransferase family 4 protein [Nitrospirota bacterium]